MLNYYEQAIYLLWLGSVLVSFFRTCRERKVNVAEISLIALIFVQLYDEICLKSNMYIEIASNEFLYFCENSLEYFEKKSVAADAQRLLFHSKRIQLNKYFGHCLLVDSYIMLLYFTCASAVCK